MFTIIVAVGLNGEIGTKNHLCFSIKADMKHFKETTYGKEVLMGRKTFDSLPKKPLPERKNYVVTRSAHYENKEVSVINDLDEFISKYKDSDNEIFICGGAEIYKKFLPYCKKMIITEIQETYNEADTFFPKFDFSSWRKKVLVDDYDEDRNTHNLVNYKIVEYSK